MARGKWSRDQRLGDSRIRSCARGISFAEFASPETEHLERIMKGEIQWALTRMYQHYDAIAELLVPTEFAAKIRAETNEDRTTKKPHGKNQDFGLNFGE